MELGDISDKNRQLMALAENAKGMNTYEPFMPSGQQPFLHKLFMAEDAAYKCQQIEELTK